MRLPTFPSAILSLMKVSFVPHILTNTWFVILSFRYFILIWISLISADVKHLFIYFFRIYIFPLVKYSFTYFEQIFFKIRLFILSLCYKSSLYILDRSPVSSIYSGDTFFLVSGDFIIFFLIYFKNKSF